MAGAAQHLSIFEHAAVAAKPVILVVEDDPTQRFLYRQALEAAGFAVEAAADGATALASFARHSPALVLLDVLMPDVDGFAVCTTLRGTEAGRKTPILMMTSLDDLVSIERAYHAGATDFISKPFNWKILVHRIRYMLRADETLRRLEESERRLAEAQRIAAVANFVWRIGTPALSGSVELLHIFGLADQGKAVLLRAVLRRISPDERRTLLRAVRATLRAGSPLQCDLSLAGPDTSVHSIELRAELGVDAAGASLIQGTVQDISERKRAEAALVAARHAAEGADALKTALLAGMNHELRTPLNAIIGFSELLAAGALGPSNEARYREFAGDIHRAGCHMLDLVTDVLEMAKLVSGRYTPNFEPADLREIAADAVASVREVEFASGRDVALVDWDGPMRAKLDRRAVRRMLIHLLTNALKFSAPTASVEVACRRDASGELWVTVIDHGIGMTEKEATLAIAPFQQIDNRLARKHEGSGLGLSLVDQLILHHGGRLVIESKRDEGSQISLVFPKELVLTAVEPAA